MIDNQAPEEKHQQPASPGKGRNKDKKPYQKPAFRYERVFETQALSCGKVAATVSTCQFNVNTS